MGRNPLKGHWHVCIKEGMRQGYRYYRSKIAFGGDALRKVSFLFSLVDGISSKRKHIEIETLQFQLPSPWKWLIFWPEKGRSLGFFFCKCPAVTGKAPFCTPRKGGPAENDGVALSLSPPATSESMASASCATASTMGAKRDDVESQVPDMTRILDGLFIGKCVC